jgi:prepilin-type N-terminal cleavage/methylation domain-containing protein
MHSASPNERTDAVKTIPPSRSDRGFTLVEILVVIAILGVVATVVAFSVRGVADEGDESACGADARTLVGAAEVYMAEENVEMLPGIGTGPNRYELFLVDAQLLTQISTKYDLNEDGTVTSTGAPCT